MSCCSKSFQSCQTLRTYGTVACQALLSMACSRQEYWSRLPCHSPEVLPNPGIKPTSLKSPALAGGFFNTSATWEALESEIAQSCVTLCDPMDCSLPVSFVHGIFQTRILEWVAISFSRRSCQPKDWTWFSRVVVRCFTIWATREVQGRYTIW